MTSKEKYLQKLAGKESPAVVNAKQRIKDREWLKESQKLALRILLRLDELKWTQKKLAEELEVSAQYVNKLLKGKEKFGWDNLIAIQRILKMPILYGTQQKLDVSEKTYFNSGEIALPESSEVKTEQKGKMKMGKIIPLFNSDSPQYYELQTALEN